MKLLYISFSLSCLLLFTTSCSYFKRSDDIKVIYTVKYDKVNVRQKPNLSSTIIGTVYKGDTIIPTTNRQTSYIAFDYKGERGYAAKSTLIGFSVLDMAKVSNMQLGKIETIIRNYLNYYVNWRKGRFWLVFLVLIVVSYILIKLGDKLEDYMYKYSNYDDFNYNKLPYNSAFIGGLFSIVYLFFREDVLQALFVSKFYWIPHGDTWLHWFLWSISIVGVIGIIYFWVKDFIHYGFRGIITVLYFTLTAIITFIAGIFGGIIVILITGLEIVFSAFSDS